ncbi:cation-transporting P-type ATPase A/B/Cu+-exporting ATPase [Saccharopolyspora shandongensis]|uniref:Cation-transporting P-type ATPase B n=1 Tax=Saccharopolyspora shandongensis TaxID=418495 RepID=A0A1H3KDT0_9PSEU|nr:cation-transporting P-type ATPase A/B/Cu+-exporting ATPase [Saccharopolyspora shandongensis]
MKSLTADSTGVGRRVELSVSGMTCAACSARIERKLNKLDGVHATVNYAARRASVTAASSVDDALLVETVEKAGYQAAVLAPASEAEPDDDRARDLWRRMVVSIALFVPICDLSLLFMFLPQARFTGWQWLLLVLALPVVGWAAWPLHRAALINARHRASSMDTLVSLGITAATGWSLYAMFFQTGSAGDAVGWRLLLRPEGAIYLEVAAGVTAFVLAGRYVEARAHRNAGDALRELAALGAKAVTVLLDDGSQRQVPVDELGVGQRFLVRAGETIGTDGRVVDGQAAVDCSAMTGESVPVEVIANDEVVGGTVVLNGWLVVEATRVGQDTQLAAMVRMVEEAQSGKAAVQRLADRISAYFVPAVLVAAAGTLLGWLLAVGSPQEAFTAALAVLVIACPCALGLATPTALMVASGRAAQLGIFIKGYRSLESTQDIDTVVLDKTGTVTDGRMTVVEVSCVPDVDVRRVLRLAGAVEDVSEHAVAAAISSHARAELETLPQVERFAGMPGLGATGIVEGHDVLVGRAKLFHERGLVLPEDLDRTRRKWEQQGNTTVVVGCDGSAVAVIAVADRVKPSAAAAVAELHRIGLRTVMLTGDNDATARKVAEEVGIGEVIAEVLPDEKVEVVRRLQSEGRAVAVVGDGVNDAPALACADLGLAIGSGTHVAINAADIVLVREDLTAVPDSIRLARRTLRTIRGNLVWAFGYNVAALPLAALGLLNPLIAAAAMALSSVLVVSNSQRLRRFSGSTAHRDGDTALPEA